MGAPVGLRRRLLDYGLAALALAVPALILSASMKDPAKQNGFDQAVLRISSPLQAAVSWIVEGVGGAIHSYGYLVDVEEENRELRRENLALRDQLVTARRAAADTSMLEEIVGLRKRTPADTVGARVISASLSPYFRVLRIRIDRGADAVQPGMPVINADGLVGRVQKVYGEYSDVLLATDPKSSIPVYIPRTSGRGGLRGLGKNESAACEISRLDRSKQVKVGDLVVTSGLGDAFPANIPVGEISSVDTEEVGLFQKVEVAPSVDFSALDNVLVLVAPPPPTDPSAGQQKRSARAIGMTPF